MFGGFNKLWEAAIVFLILAVCASAVLAILAKYLTTLVIVACIVMVGRIVWSRTRW